MGKRTVKEGEAVAVWDQHGRHTQVEGPRLLRLWMSTIRFLERHVAGVDEYLRVHRRDGIIEHFRGPKVLFENPVFHCSVKVERAINLLDSTSAVVVMRAAGKISASPCLSIVKGPMIFFPEADEVVHKFKWSDSGAGMLIDGRVWTSRPGVRKLQLSVRGACDHCAQLSVDINVRSDSVESALLLPDPVAECDTITKAKIVEALAEVRLADSGSSLDNAVRSALGPQFMAMLAQALQPAALQLLSIAVVGVTPSAELEKMHRAQDELAEAKVGSQLSMLTLDAAMDRLDREHALASAKQANELSLASKRAQARRADDDYEDQRRLAYYKELGKLGVDLTKYLCTVGDHLPRGSEKDAGCWKL